MEPTAHGLQDVNRDKNRLLLDGWCLEMQWDK